MCLSMLELFIDFLLSISCHMTAMPNDLFEITEVVPRGILSTLSIDNPQLHANSAIIGVVIYLLCAQGPDPGQAVQPHYGTRLAGFRGPIIVSATTFIYVCVYGFLHIVVLESPNHLQCFLALCCYTAFVRLLQCLFTLYFNFNYSILKSF